MLGQLDVIAVAPAATADAAVASSDLLAELARRAPVPLVQIERVGVDEPDRAIRRDLANADPVRQPFLRNRLLNFIALHIVRSPAWRTWHGDQVAVRVADAIEDDPSAEEIQMEVARRLVSDPERTKTVLGQLTKLASSLASMHWSLLQFDDRVLALSDQPVCTVPLSSAIGDAPVEVVPATGFADVLEIRVPVSPSIALILTWFDHPEERLVHHGTFDQACSLNASVIAQADRHWMRHPDGTGIRLRPQLLRAIADPVSPQLLDNYDPGAVLQSRRRREAKALVDNLIERGVTDGVGWVSLQPGELAV